MQTRRMFSVPYLAISGILLVLSSSMVAQEQQRGRDKYLCSEPQPEKICTAENVCGSSSAPCTVNIKRSGSDASATPNIPNAKANRPFCVKAGTTVTWESSSKNTGFVVDFGPDSPFSQDAIMGGSDRPVSAVAKKKGCYKYSAGACVSGSVYGMCGSVETELIIIGSE
jgi:plastocyanin